MQPILPELGVPQSTSQKKSWLPEIQVKHLLTHTAGFGKVGGLTDLQFRPGTAFPIHWLDITVPVGLTGIWMFMFARNLRSRSLMPVNDPYFKEAFAHEAH